ncbi:unnamed protein product [Triticum turgidum subsp. durum]|uniref:RING-type E3 ubiquitin transferase n=1 Tax=Triticum turgidum subsp. durum TaxID=4567 RepID=A0A9R1S9W8_TRITD|nr:unnamed protein product [Triticum turgidum subsp. durum]
MGHGLSCSRDGDEHDFFRAAQAGDVDALDALLAADPALARRATIYDRLTALHVAAANGCLPAVDMLLARAVRPDVVDRRKRTPLMLAATHGHIDCALALLRAGANILMFDSVNARTCLHHAAYYGHADCLRAILAAARTTPVADSWGFVRFVNVRDEHGATPLHVAARQGRPECVHLLLESGAIVSAPTGSYGFPGSTALHLAALAEANREREKKILKGTKYSDSSSPALTDAGAGDDGDEVDDQEDEEVCSICFEQACSIEVEDCGHRMCAACTLALCCHSKPNPATLTLQPPACPFCRSCISRLVVADSKAKAVAVAGAGDEAEDKPASPRLSRRRSRRSREGSSSFKGLSSAMGSLSSKIGRGSGRLAGDGDGAFLDKLEHDLP